MQAKETVQTRWNRLRRQRGTGEKVSVDATALMRFADTAIHFLLAAVLAGASVFGDYAPFGVALVGAAGSGVCGAAALVGACFGYMVLLGFADGLRYAAAAILTFAVGFAFYDWKLLRRPWAMPLVAGFINSCTGFIYLSEGGWRTVDVIYFLTELVLIVASGWCYRQLLLPMRAGRGVELLSPARRASLTVLLCTVLMSLSGLYLVKDISLGRALAVAAVLAAAWQGGIAAGAVLGMAAGLSMDLAANGVPLYAMAFGLSGLAAGAVRGKGRLRAAGVYLLANGGAVLWTWDRGLPLSVLYEALLALPRSSCCRSALCGGWGAGWLRREASPPIRGPRPGSNSGWRPPPRPSVPCTTPCGPPFVRPGTITTWLRYLTGRPAGCAGAVRCAPAAGSGTM